MSTTLRIAMMMAGLSIIPATWAQEPPPSPGLRVSDDGHHLVGRDGKPFFYLADTGWELFSRTTRDEVIHYLDDRKRKRFTVIQTAFLALAEGPNALSDRPVRYDDLSPITTPGADSDDAEAYDYWDHVDFVLDAATARGFFISVAPFRQQLLPGREADAERYARFLGKRHGQRPNLIWPVGFDSSPEQIEARAETYRAVARGIAAGAGGDEQVFLSFHPAGKNSSSRWFHDDRWLRFNMAQTGHGRDTPSWEWIERDYARLPAKPIIDVEATYEAHPVSDPATGNRTLSDDADVRKYAYWNLFAGACGHTYGHHSVWQMYVPGRHKEGYGAVIGWREALDAPGAGQMRHVRALIESRPIASRVPDQSIVVDPPRGGAHIQAARGDGYTFIYSAEGQPFVAVLGKISGDRLRALWFDPRTGTSAAVGEFPNQGARKFKPPTQGRGQDWVLILDDVAKGYAAPGRDG